MSVRLTVFSSECACKVQRGVSVIYEVGYNVHGRVVRVTYNEEFQCCTKWSFSSIKCAVSVLYKVEFQ